MLSLYKRINTIFDALNHFWDGTVLRRWLTLLLVASFFLTLLLIEIKRLMLSLGWLPPSLFSRLPSNHFYAVNLVFTVLLVIEVASLAFSIAGSVANALGKQFEILSLILLRQSFKEFVYFDEPIVWEKIELPVLHMISDAAGGLVLFFAVWIYYRIQLHRTITADPEERYRFVTAKKCLSLALLLVFMILGVVVVWEWFSPGYQSSAAHQSPPFDFFAAFYTVLVFSDILLVLISLRYSSHYPIVFRNSGFALATVFIRLALTAPPFVNVAIAGVAIAFAIGLSLVYRTFVNGEKVDMPA